MSGNWELIEWIQSKGCNVAARNGVLIDVALEFTRLIN